MRIHDDPALAPRLCPNIVTKPAWTDRQLFGTLSPFFDGSEGKYREGTVPARRGKGFKEEGEMRFLRKSGLFVCLLWFVAAPRTVSAIDWVPDWVPTIGKSDKAPSGAKKKPPSLLRKMTFQTKQFFRKTADLVPGTGSSRKVARNDFQNSRGKSGWSLWPFQRDKPRPSETIGDFLSQPRPGVPPRDR